ALEQPFLDVLVLALALVVPGFLWHSIPPFRTFKTPKRRLLWRLFGKLSAAQAAACYQRYQRRSGPWTMRPTSQTTRAMAATHHRMCRVNPAPNSSSVMIRNATSNPISPPLFRSPLYCQTSCRTATHYPFSTQVCLAVVPNPTSRPLPLILWDWFP